MIRFGGEDLKVYLYRDPVDMRKGRNCLAALAQEVMKVDLFSGGLVIFISRRYNAVKLLYWHRNGFVKPSTEDPRHQLRTSVALLSMASLVRA